MKQEDMELRTRRTKTRYGTKKMIAGQPVVVIKSRHREDYMTPEEILEDLYGRQVERIIFKNEP